MPSETTVLAVTSTAAYPHAQRAVSVALYVSTAVAAAAVAAVTVVVVVVAAAVTAVFSLQTGVTPPSRGERDKTRKMRPVLRQR
jgi:hypothetical protein